MYDDREMESKVGYMLQSGVTTAAIIVIAGAVLYLKRAARQPLPDYAHFRDVSSPLVSIGSEWHGLLSGNASAVIGAGLMVLILTPVLRVLMCILGFIQKRNWLYVVVSSIVLIVLLYSLLHLR